MRIRYQPRGDGASVQTDELHWLNIEIDGTDQQGRMSTTVCNIEISAPERGPKSARFFVSVGIDSNGKPYAQVTGLKPTTDSSKSVRASWMDFGARRAEKLGEDAR